MVREKFRRQELEGNLRRYGFQSHGVCSAASGGTVPLAYARGSVGLDRVGGATAVLTEARDSEDLDRIW